MRVEWDPAKNRRNIAQHGLSFADFVGFDDQPLEVEDSRNDYGETRFRAFGRIGGKAHCLVYTVRGDTRRLISFRRAHEKELRRHGC